MTLIQLFINDPWIPLLFDNSVIFIIESIYFIIYSENSDSRHKEIFEDWIKHGNNDHQCKYFENGCPFEKIKFMKKESIKLEPDQQKKKKFNIMK